MIKCDLHHVGIVVPDRDRMNQLLPLLGLAEQDACYVPEYQAQCVFVGGARGRLEFIMPDADSRLAAFNGGRGGLHHVALEVADLRATMAELAAQGVQCLEEEPVRAGNLLINFVLPVATRGFIVEYVQTMRESQVG